MSKIARPHVVRGSWVNADGKTFGIRIGTGNTSVFIEDSEVLRVATELADHYQQTIHNDKRRANR